MLGIWQKIYLNEHRALCLVSEPLFNIVILLSVINFILSTEFLSSLKHWGSHSLL